MCNISPDSTFFLLLFSYSWPHFPPIALPCPAHPTSPPFSPPPTPLSLSMGPLYMVLDLTLPLFPPLPPSPIPSGHCRIVLYHLGPSIIVKHIQSRPECHFRLTDGFKFLFHCDSWRSHFSYFSCKLMYTCKTIFS